MTDKELMQALYAEGIEPCGLAGPNYWHPLPSPPAIANQEAQDGR